MNANIDITSSILQTKRLILRPFTNNDLNDVHYYCSLKDSTNSYGFLPHTSLEQSKELLNKWIESKNVFAIVLKETNKVIGNIGLSKLMPSIKQINDSELLGVNIDFMISKDYWNLGIATEALKAIISHSFFSRHLDFLICGHFKDNIASQKVIEKCGFKYYTSGTFTNKEMGQIETIDYILFNYYKRNNCHCELCLNHSSCLCKICPNENFCKINHQIECKYKVN